MTSVLRNTTFDLNDGTGDYLEIEVALAAPHGAVEVVEISHVQLVDWETGLVDEWNLLGYELAQYSDKITSHLQNYFADTAHEIAKEIADREIDGWKADSYKRKEAAS